MLKREIEYKWSTGKSYDKTPRVNIRPEHTEHTEHTEHIHNSHDIPCNKTTEQINAAINKINREKTEDHYVRGSRLIPDNISVVLQNRRANDFYDTTAINERGVRHLLSNKMSERENIIRATINPYLSENSYLHDLDAEHEFLRPKNSHFSQ